ncbi:rCG63474 [Rattus norvegicus]|uniref:RCG63474 n=1 Tax=Rattus norvegicus TaxID=10116 RepID=A6HE10_RAT|nr:rCG63474 [Rattus norvegicus]
MAASLAVASASRFPRASGLCPFWCPGQCIILSLLGKNRASKRARILAISLPSDVSSPRLQ